MPRAASAEDQHAAGISSRSQRSLEQMMSLKPGDNERTQISKKVSWILRHGARKVGLEIDADGWVLLSDLATSGILRGVPEQKLHDIILESNEQKMRYEFTETERGQAIRAVAKHTLGGVGSRGGRRRDGQAHGQQQRQEEALRRAMRSLAQGRAPELEGGGEEGHRRPPRDAGPGYDRRDRRDCDAVQTYEQQLQEGFQPVYHGGRVVAMVREGETVRPGRRAEGGKAKGKSKGWEKGEGGDAGRVWEDRRPPREGHPPWHAGAPAQDWRPPFEGRPSWDMGGPSQDGRPWGGKGRGKACGSGPRDVPAPPPVVNLGLLRDDLGRRQGGDDPSFDSRPRWRAQSGQEAIMRATKFVDSEQVGVIPPGAIVVQIGDEEVMQHGISRMPVQYYNEAVDIIVRGWVTRTAEAARGPVFFRPADEGGPPSGGKGPLDRGKGAHKGYPQPQSGKGQNRFARPPQSRNVEDYMGDLRYAGQLGENFSF